MRAIARSVPRLGAGGPMLPLARESHEETAMSNQVGADEHDGTALPASRDGTR
jgi:hypothetical protein